MYLKFHHVIGDGVSAAETVNHLFMIINGQTPSVPKTAIDLQSLFDQITEEEALQPPLEKGDTTLRSSQFDHLMLSFETSEIIIEATKSAQIRIHALLFSALILAWKEVSSLSFETFYALTVVNCRPYFNPPVSREVMRSLFTFLYLELNTKDRELLELAREIDTKLHSRLDAKEHLAPLSNKSAEELSPADYSDRMQLPQNMLCVTNVGKVLFSGEYDHHRITELFFTPAVHAYYNKHYQGTLSAITLRGCIHLAFSSVQGCFPPEKAHKILTQMNELFFTTTSLRVCLCILFNKDNQEDLLLLLILLAACTNP